MKFENNLCQHQWIWLNSMHQGLSLCLICGCLGAHSLTLVSEMCLQYVCPSDGGAGRRNGPSADCHERTEVSACVYGFQSLLKLLPVPCDCRLLQSELWVGVGGQLAHTARFFFCPD